ncbi:MAG: 4Fe-4S dicluster domain-containing protein, partial [Candidatus Omnitrophica bacterium]|nr:4Fe-4S dicluster domain-containing protein [Candidatus Omnitrophota bacterium]
TSGILLLNKKEARILEEENCIRCGTCLRKCPMSLMSTVIAHAARKEDWPQAKLYGALDCIECGVCTYVCPSSIKLVQSIKRAKQELMTR